MSGLEVYLICAIATAFSSLYEILRVARGRASADNVIVKNPIRAHIVMFLISFLLAPVIFPLMLSERGSEALIGGLVSDK